MASGIFEGPSGTLRYQQVSKVWGTSRNYGDQQELPGTPRDQQELPGTSMAGTLRDQQELWETSRNSEGPAGTPRDSEGQAGTPRDQKLSGTTTRRNCKGSAENRDQSPLSRNLAAVWIVEPEERIKLAKNVLSNSQTQRSDHRTGHKW